MDERSTDNSDESLEEYLEISAKTASKVHDDESKGWDKNRLRHLYRSSHLFSAEHFEDVPVGRIEDWNVLLVPLEQPTAAPELGIDVVSQVAANVR